MCDDGALPEKPIYGGNNWYYAYGNSSDEEILREMIRSVTKVKDISEYAKYEEMPKE